MKSVALDCDGDALLVRVEQIGAACHTGARTCFFTDLDATVGAPTHATGPAAGAMSEIDQHDLKPTHEQHPTEDPA